MKAWQFIGREYDLQLLEVELPPLKSHEVRIRIEACALCRTDLHILDGDLSNQKNSLTLGHEIVGTVEKRGEAVIDIAIGDRVGVPWLGSACMTCHFCLTGRENLCDSALFTGYNIDGGFAEYAQADARFCFAIPAVFTPAQAAPLLCAGLIGWRSFSFVGNSNSIGLYGFGAAAHIVTQIAVGQGKEIFAFTSPGDKAKQNFARALGAKWAGGSDVDAPELLDAAIIFAPVGALIPIALKSVKKGGVVVCGGIHMTDIPSFPYSLLWGERTIKSVANLTRADGHQFFAEASRLKIEPHVVEFELEKLNDAIEQFRKGAINGAAVIMP